MDTQVINDTMTAWRENPDKARVSPTVTARSEGAQAVIEAGPFTLRADLPPPLGGTNQAPPPAALLLSALAGCAIVFVRDVLAPQAGIRVDTMEATARCDADLRGFVGMDDALPDLTNMTLDVTVGSPDGSAAATELSRIWQERCPVYLALINPIEVKVSFKEATTHV